MKKYIVKISVPCNNGIQYLEPSDIKLGKSLVFNLTDGKKYRSNISSARIDTVKRKFATVLIVCNIDDSTYSRYFTGNTDLDFAEFILGKCILGSVNYIDEYMCS